MKKLVQISLILLVTVAFTQCKETKDKLLGRWELSKQHCNTKGEGCKKADTAVYLEFKDDGKCIKNIAYQHPSVYIYRLKENKVSMKLYENDSVLKNFEIIDMNFSGNEMLIRWEYYTECDKYIKP